MAIVLLLNIKVFLYPIQRVLISMESHTSDKKERCRPRTRSKGAIANDASTVGKIKWTFHGLSSLLSIRNSLIEFHKSPDKNRRVACYSPGGKGRTFEKYARNKRKGAKKKKNRGRVEKLGEKRCRLGRRKKLQLKTSGEGLKRVRADGSNPGL